MAEFHKATKKQSFLRMALIGPSGSGKTYSSLKIAEGLGTKIAVIDSERGSASKYAGDFEFDTLELDTDFSPNEYIKAIGQAVEHGYEVLIIDSLSHAWNDKGGVLELKDAFAAKESSNSEFSAWRKVTPMHNALVDAILRAPLHVITTLRTKTEHVIEKDERGKTVIRKIGLKPIQRDGLEYEFDVVGDLDQSNTLTITKTRCSSLFEAVIAHPDAMNVGKPLKQWLTDGAAPLVSDVQSKALWAEAKAHDLSLGGLVDFINATLKTQYASPREMNVEELPKVLAELKMHKTESAAS